MKKILFILLFLLGMAPVYAKEPARLVTLTNQCGVLKEDTLVVPVEVVSLNDGGMSKLISEYVLGEMENQDTFTIEVKNLESKSVASIEIDKLKDSQSYSHVKYRLTDDVDLAKGETLATFDLKVKFQEEVPDTIFVLGNEIHVSMDESICALINGYKVDVVEYEKVIEHNNMVLYTVVFGLGLVVILESAFLIRSKSKK